MKKALLFSKNRKEVRIHKDGCDTSYTVTSGWKTGIGSRLSVNTRPNSCAGGTRVSAAGKKQTHCGVTTLSKSVHIQRLHQCAKRGQRGRHKTNTPQSYKSVNIQSVHQCAKQSQRGRHKTNTPLSKSIHIQLDTQQHRKNVNVHTLKPHTEHSKV
jgi:hypothetical protein